MWFELFGLAFSYAHVVSSAGTLSPSSRPRQPQGPNQRRWSTTTTTTTYGGILSSMYPLRPHRHPVIHARHHISLETLRLYNQGSTCSSFVPAWVRDDQKEARRPRWRRARAQAQTRRQRRRRRQQRQRCRRRGGRCR